MTHSEAKLPAPPQRDRVIPLRKSALLDALLAEGNLSDAEREKLRQFARLLGAVFHYEYFDELERLRETYFYFNPDIDPGARAAIDLDETYKALTGEFARVLAQANFVELPHDEIARAHAERATVPVKIRAPVEEFREVRIFRRGRHMESIDVPVWFGLRKRSQEVEVYDDVVLMVAAKPAPAGVTPAKHRSGALAIRPGAVLFKYFRHIASGDLNALFPNVRVVMSLSDQLKLGVPAIVGGIPILLKIASTATVLFLVLGFYLGFSNAIGDDEIKGALAALAAVAALGAFLLRQWGNFHRQSLAHQKQLADNIYYRNVNNNAGIFDYIIGAAEEQEWKEALLAYHVLLTATAPLARDDLDARIEDFLARAAGAAVDFQIDEALEKLKRLHLLIDHNGQLSVPPLSEALVRLDRTWDDYFAPAKSGLSPAPSPWP